MVLRLRRCLFVIRRLPLRRPLSSQNPRTLVLKLHHSNLESGGPHGGSQLMGDAADYLFETASAQDEMERAALANGAKPCSKCNGAGYLVQQDDVLCKECDGFGWFDKHGNPCEL